MSRRDPTTENALLRCGSRRGSLTIEMILVVVVLTTVTIGIVQFGVFYANADEVALAARVGAIEASQTAGLPAAGTVPGNIVSAIEHQLASSNIQWCHIRLEHNVGPGGVLESNFGAPGDCDCAGKTPLPDAPHFGTEYVRLTVCVPLQQVFPQQLSLFGSQLYAADKTYEHTAVFRYEL
jgi:hypothetical protein